MKHPQHSLSRLSRFSLYTSRGLSSLLIASLALSAMVGCDDDEPSSEAGTEVAGTEVAGTEVAGAEVAGTEVAGTEAGMMAGTVVAGTEAGMMAGTEMSGLITELDEAGRRMFCETQINTLLGLIPTEAAERDAYITQTCTMSGLLKENAMACEAEVASCRAQLEGADVEAAITDCMSGDIFNTCQATVAEVTSCQVGQITFYANMIQNINIGGLTCAAAGDILQLGALLPQLMPAPADLCTEAASICLQ